MNLLFDKREKDNQPGPDGSEFNERSGSSKAKRVKPAKKARPEKLKKPRKKINMLWLYLFIIPLTVLVLVMSYIYYFKRDLLLKPKSKVTFSNTVTVDSSANAMQHQDSLMVPADTMTQQQTGMTDLQPVMQDTVPVMAQPRTQTMQQPVVRRPADGSFPSIQLLSGIVKLSGSNVSVSSIYIDENTFSVGVRTSSAGNLTEFNNALSASLPAGAVITTKPTLSGNQSLIAGTYSSSAPRQNAQQISTSALTSEIRSIIQRNNAFRQEVSVSQPQSWNGGKRSQGFMKISGQLVNCQSIVQDILTAGWNITVSKIIVMPDNSSSGTLVLRFFLNNPA